MLAAALLAAACGSDGVDRGAIESELLALDVPAPVVACVADAMADEGIGAAALEATTDPRLVEIVTVCSELARPDPAAASDASTRGDEDEPDPAE